MIDNVVALRDAWRSVLMVLGVSAQGRIVIGGPLAPSIGEAVPVGLSGNTSSLATLGSGPDVGASATPAATSLEDGSIDVVIMLGAWATVHELAEVAREAGRILRPGGIVWFGRRDLDAVLQSTPATNRSVLMYRSYPSSVTHVAQSAGMGFALELALVRARFRSVSTDSVALPSAALSSIDDYVDAVEKGMWPGVERLTVEDRKALTRDIRQSLRGAIFPMVEYQPWYLVSAIRST